jgi:RNA polymerase sigma-70 factor (ECF subfamily)
VGIDETSIEDLLERAGRSEQSAVGRLLEYHRRRLRRMVAARLNQKLAARIDPSDVVQEALFEAQGRLPEYIRQRPVPFFVWLREIARDRLVGWVRRHTAQKRNAFRDLSMSGSSSGAGGQTLVDSLVDSGTSPSSRAIRAEERALTLGLLNQLAPADRRVLELRYVDGLPIAAIASALGIGVGAAQMRHLRALERLRKLLDRTCLDSEA